MYKVASIRLDDSDVKIENVEIWSDSEASADKYGFTSVYQRIPVDIDYKQIPLSLLQHRWCIVYSQDRKTGSFFESVLVNRSIGRGARLGILYRNEQHSYLVFYFHRESGQIRCLVMDLGRLKRNSDSLEEKLVLSELDTNIFVDLTDQATRGPNVSVFDKVLQKRRGSTPINSEYKSSSISLSSSKLTTTEQINRAVNKVILSGLRIRGLSTTSTESMNEKLAIKEIYQMTLKATQFALRKFNYSFNESKNCSIKLDEIQDIVERLLEIFVDVNEAGPSSISSSK